jgi:phosphate transport system substrate-binding protein
LPRQPGGDAPVVGHDRRNPRDQNSPRASRRARARSHVRGRRLLRRLDPGTARRRWRRRGDQRLGQLDRRADLVAELFKESNPDFNYTIEGPGTGDGFKRFCAGETDISDASRAIKDEEAQSCADAGIDYVELKIAYDGITVMTSTENDAVDCLSFADLYALLGPESIGFSKWSDGAAIASELGSSTTLPDADLTITGPGEESGTFDTFVELVLAKTAEERGQDATTRPDYTSSANDNVIIEGITGSPTSLGWVGFAFAEENQDKVKELAVSEEANGECIAPSSETIADGSYPISRPLFIYVNTSRAMENPDVAAYVDFYLAEGTISTVLETVPYVNLPTDELDATRSAWEAAR